MRRFLTLGVAMVSISIYGTAQTITEIANIETTWPPDTPEGIGVLVELDVKNKRPWVETTPVIQRGLWPTMLASSGRVGAVLVSGGDGLRAVTVGSAEGRPQGPEGWGFLSPGRGRVLAMRKWKPAFACRHRPSWDWRAPFLCPAYVDGINMLSRYGHPHPYRRGISWLWPHVEVGGRVYDMTSFDGPTIDFDKETSRSVGEDVLELVTRNRWHAESRRSPIVQEDLRLRVFPANNNGLEVGMILDFLFTWTATDKPVTIRSERPDGEPRVGGFGIRFGPRKGEVVTTSKGVRNNGNDVQRGATWADYSARLRGSTELRGAALFVKPDKSGHTPEWVIHHGSKPDPDYPAGFEYIGDHWPGKTGVTLQPGEPVQRHYRVYLHQGDAAEARVADFHRTWVNPPKVRVLRPR